MATKSLSRADRENVKVKASRKIADHWYQLVLLEKDSQI